MSEDAQLIRFFTTRQGGDIYVFMASLCFECDEAAVTKEQRTCAKQLSLAIQYGMGSDNMAKKLTRFNGRTYTEYEATRLIQKWKEKFSGVTRFMAKARQEALVHVSCAATTSTHVCVLSVVCLALTTPLLCFTLAVQRTDVVGSHQADTWSATRNTTQSPQSEPPADTHSCARLSLPLCADIQHGNSWNRSRAERQSVNSVIQGTAADMAKRAMIAIHEHVRALHEQRGRPFPSLARLTLQLHDEIILEVRSGLEAEVAAVVRHCMESVFVPPRGEAEARVPFPVSLKVGRTLGSLQPFELPREQPQLPQPEQQQRSDSQAVAGGGGVEDEVRALMELAATDVDEWNDYSLPTPTSQQLHSSLASTGTAQSTPSTPRTTASPESSSMQ